MNLAGHRDRRLSENYFEPCVISMNISSILKCVVKYFREDGPYALNARISIFPDDKCYLLSEGLVNLTRVWHSPFLYQMF